MVELKQHCGVDGDNFSDVVHKAAHQLGIDRGKSLELAIVHAAAGIGVRWPRGGSWRL